MTPKALARKLGVAETSYREFRGPSAPWPARARYRSARTTPSARPRLCPRAEGTFKRLLRRRRRRPRPDRGGPPPHEYHVPDHLAYDAATGDEVEIAHPPQAVPRRATAWPRSATSWSGPPGSSSAPTSSATARASSAWTAASSPTASPSATRRRRASEPNDKVVFEMLRFPTADGPRRGRHHRGPRPARRARRRYAVVIRAFGLPDEFPEDALDEARDQARDVPRGRPRRPRRISPTSSSSPSTRSTPATSTTPCRLTRDPETGHWLLTVHIADVAHFAPPGGPLDREARDRGTERLPAAARHPDVPGGDLQRPRQPAAGQGPVRQDGRRWTSRRRGRSRRPRFANGAIREPQAFTYEQVQALLDHPHGDAAEAASPPEVVRMLATTCATWR